jgi:gluconate 2-dehydrogenase gamma chain
MDHENDDRLGRRASLQGVAAITGTLSLLSPPTPRAQDTRAIRSAGADEFRGLPAPEVGYRSLGLDEAGFVEALVNETASTDALGPWARTTQVELRRGITA